MSKLIIPGGTKLKGTLRVHGAKNAALPLLAASIMTEQDVELLDVPNITDIHVMTEILRQLGTTVTRSGSTIKIGPESLSKGEIPEDLMSEMRSSIVLLGPLLGRLGTAVVTYPGGCEIGPRPIDLHLKGLTKLGCQVEENEGRIRVYTSSKELRGNTVHLDFPSVGATENIMMAAVFARGVTRIKNAAMEPEIVELQKFINSMGGKIQGAGTRDIKIHGIGDRKKLGPIKYKVKPDRIVTGTFMLAAALTQGKLTLQNVIPEQVAAVTDKLRESGVQVIEGEDTITVVSPDRYSVINEIKTQPYPGFPTDMQPQMTVYCTQLPGNCRIHENVFQGRFKHVDELRKMGASIDVEDGTAYISGKTPLKGTIIEASDLRAGAALILAALVAKGITTIENLHHLDRGYESIEKMLNKLGVCAERIHDDTVLEENAR